MAARHRAVIAAEKPRSQASLCTTLQVGLQAQLADMEGPLYVYVITLGLPGPTDDTRKILTRAPAGADSEPGPYIATRSVPS